MTTAEAVDDVHPNTKNANISAHAEMSWYEPLVASNRSFDDRDRDCAAAVALGEAQNGMGQKLVDGAGEITEEAQRAQSHKDILSDTEKQTYSDQLLHLAKLGLPLNRLPTQVALLERYIAAREEKEKEFQRSYEFVKNAIAKHDEAMARVSSPQLSPHTDICPPTAINNKSEKGSKTAAVVADQTRSVKRAPRKRKARQNAPYAVAQSERIGTKRTKRLERLGLSDHGPDPTPLMLAEAYAGQMQKFKTIEFASKKKKQKAKKRVSRAFRNLMKACAEEKTSCD